MRDFSDNIFKGTAMEGVQIVKTTYEPKSIVKEPIVVETKPEKIKATNLVTDLNTTAKRGKKKKAGKAIFVPPSHKGNRRSPDFASIRVPKDFTEALSVLFDGKRLTHIMDLVICDYLNRHQTQLAEKYRQQNPFE